MHRVLISGISGSGKTTLARRVAAATGLPRHELDALHHGPGWVKRPTFEADVAAFARDDRWITEDQYHRHLGDLLWRRADTVLWLDLPRRAVMQRVLRRSVGRAISRRELFNGNHEDFRAWLDPGHPIRWAWSQHADRRATTLDLIAAHPEVRVVRFHNAADVRRWLSVQPWSKAWRRR